MSLDVEGHLEFLGPHGEVVTLTTTDGHPVLHFDHVKTLGRILTIPSLRAVVTHHQATLVQALARTGAKLEVRVGSFSLGSLGPESSNLSALFHRLTKLVT